MSMIRWGVVTFLTAYVMGGPNSATVAQGRKDDRAVASKRAEADYLRARLDRVEAELAELTYIEVLFEQDLQVAWGEIARAETDLKRSIDRLSPAERMPGLRPTLSDELNLRRSQYNLDQAKTKLRVLQAYTREKTLKELRIEVAKARAVERAKKADYERAKAGQGDR